MHKLGVDMDLRKHFGIWERCGNTAYWRMIRKFSIPQIQHLFVNPIEGVQIFAMEYPAVGGPAFRVWVRNAQNVEDKDFKEALSQVQPWVKRILGDFFTGLGVVYAGLSRETPLSFFVKYYEDQTPEYVRTGEGHKEVGKDEALMATMTILGQLGEKSMAFEKIILKEEWDEFLENYGILEC